MTDPKTILAVSVWAKFRELGLTFDDLDPIFSGYGFDPRGKEFRDELLRLQSKFSFDAGEKKEESINISLEESYTAVTE
jgi:hypothetical protein